MIKKSLNTYSTYRKISDLLVGLGTLLIDGDALIDYIRLYSNNLSKFEVNLFTRKLQKCGFDKIEILFFSDYFTKTEKYSQDDLRTIFSNQVLLLFKNCETDAKWIEYIENEQISTILTNTHLNCKESWILNSYIPKIMESNEINISLLNELDFSGASVSTFVIDYRLLLEDDFSIVNRKDSKDLESNVVSDNNFDLINIDNENVESILQNRELEITNMATNTSDFPYSYESLWMTKVQYKKYQEKNNDTKNKLRNNQKYARYMEIFSQSLSSSRNYHHKIVIGSAGTNQNTKKNTIETSQQNNSEQLVVADRDQVENIENVILKGLELSDKMLKIDSFIEQAPKAIHSKMFVYLLRKLKIKLSRQSNSNTKMENTKLCFLIKEIVENHQELLEVSELEGYLMELEKLGFKETAKFLNKNVLPSRKIDEDSFNNEIFLQLKYNGDKFKRTLNSKNDPRVRFKPDEWQVKLLDVVDRFDSALVCCPTSSGKTFICYYAMEKILRSANLNDMIIYVSPNKSLVNQIIAEVYLRFGDRKYPMGMKKTVYASSMPDYNINDPYDCQILITVPQMLETLLCLNANSKWIENIKYVIIDEIQTVNDPEQGSSIEKIMHFLDCPILGLSATISNFEEFYNWFDSIERFKNKRLLHRILHFERYCDLQRFLFVPKEFAIDNNLVPVSDMLVYSKSYLKKHDFAHDFHLLPNEIATILDSLEKVIDENNQEQVTMIYDSFPDSFFKTTLISKNDVKEFEKFLMGNFKNWIMNDVFSEEQLSHLYSLLNGKCEKAFEVIKSKYGSKYSTEEWALDNIYELVENLRINKMLPAIVFTKSMQFADDLVRKLVTTLQSKQQNEQSSKRHVEKEKSLKDELKSLENHSKTLEKKLKSPEDDILEIEKESSRIKERISSLENELNKGL